MLLDFLNRRKKWLLLVAVPLILLSIFCVWTLIILNQKNFYKGIVIEGVDVSGLSKSEAKTIIENEITENFKDKTITLQYKDKSWPIKLSDISYSFLTGKTLENAYLLGRTGSVFKRLQTIRKMGTDVIGYSCETDFDREKLRNMLADIKKQVDKQEEDATIAYNKGQVELTQHTVGTVLDVDENLKLIESRLLDRKFQNIDLMVDEKMPRVRYEDLKDVNQIISSFSTTFNAGDANRSYNIRLASTKMNNYLLMPGDVFSMDKVLGPRTTENGYRNAPIIYKNEFVEGAGGGVCQVTTTLYGTVLRAKAEVIERTPHSLPLGYVQPGQDATIAEGFIDFKFKNNFDHPILICSEVIGNRLTIKILGKKSDDYVIKLKSEILATYPPEKEEIIIDNSIPHGEKVVVRRPKNGIRVAVYREVYTKNGELLGREKISEDIYKAQRARIKVNESYFGGQVRDEYWESAE
jgi:vancomycin resistance protein YoaR